MGEEESKTISPTIDLKSKKEDTSIHGANTDVILSFKDKITQTIFELQHDSECVTEFDDNVLTVMYSTFVLRFRAEPNVITVLSWSDPKIVEAQTIFETPFKVSDADEIVRVINYVKRTFKIVCFLHSPKIDSPRRIEKEIEKSKSI